MTGEDARQESDRIRPKAVADAVGERRCKCEPLSWFGVPVPSICSSYKPDKTEPGRCLNCEHDRECHEEQQP